MSVFRLIRCRLCGEILGKASGRLPILRYGELAFGWSHGGHVQSGVTNGGLGGWTGRFQIRFDQDEQFVLALIRGRYRGCRDRSVRSLKGMPSRVEVRKARSWTPYPLSLLKHVVRRRGTA